MMQPRGSFGKSAVRLHGTQMGAFRTIQIFEIIWPDISVNL